MKKVLIGLVILFIAIQFFSDRKTNPPVKAEIDAPTEVKAIFQRACYDCHSNQTKWPWYANIAPVSWLIVNDVDNGREHFNFSDWENLSRKDKAKLKEKIWEEIVNDEMPLWQYKLLHPEAKLTQYDKSLIRNWAGK